MTRRKLYTLCGIAVLLIASSVQGLAYVRATMARYGKTAPCDLRGVARLLQITHFVAPSTCAAPDPRLRKCSGATCTLTNPPSGHSNLGICKENPSNSSQCVCTP